MDDNEIIKALKCWIKNFDGKATDFLALYNALDLINRQKAEINRLNNELYGNVEYIQEQRDVIDEKKAEIERLGKEVDRLSQVVLYHDGQIADAVKEFAERLKENKIDIDVSFGYGKEHYTEAVAVVEIDRLVKEFTEGKNDD